MNKFLVAGFGILTLAGAANAGFVPAATTTSGNATGNENIVTVMQVKEMRDDTDVILKGKIVEQIKDDKYTFVDPTGSITVEIDDEDWANQTVTPNDTIKIYGEVDRGLTKTEIDADRIEKM